MTPPSTPPSTRYFKNVCAGCHNPQLSSGGMNIQVFLDPQSLTKNRDGWEIILQKLRAGEMPPKGIPKPPAEKAGRAHRLHPGPPRRNR